MHVQVTAKSYPISGSFTISRGSKTSADVVCVEITEMGFTGRGEAVPYARYGESVEQCVEALKDRSANLVNRQIPIGLPKAAQNALDCAWWDWRAKASQRPAFKSAGLDRLTARLTAFTLSLDSPDNMAAAARRAANFPLLKLKLGREGDEERLAKIRAAVPNARLIVDANEGWDEGILPRMLTACASCGVELVEQPLRQGQDEILRTISRDLLICADESAHDVASLSDLHKKYDAVNIKLDKTGGLTPALEMAAAARALGFKIMVGCMLGSSLAMAPAFIVAQMADYVDLDGPLLLAKDVVPSIEYHDGIMQPPLPALWG